ncbi:MAG: hypothetical protein ACREJG_04520 [Candidatus Rokuibacteriota bacterium]
MNPVFSAALEIQSFCRERGWRFCFIGAVAVQRWGEPRLTQDVDLTVISGFGTETPYVDALLERFASRRPDAREFALRNRVVLARSGSGVPIDVALGAMPFEERAVERASEFRIEEGVALLTCSAEDLVVFKAFAGREKDWLDIEGIAIRRHGRLDEKLIWAELTPLLELKEAPEAAERLRATLARAQS